MPYADRERQREYQLRYLLRRREQWIDENGPCKDCGSDDRLEVDHVDRHTKVSHRVWSWSAERRSKELAKCVVRCFNCHREKTRLELYDDRTHGMRSMYLKGCRCASCREANAARSRREYTPEKRRDRYMRTGF
jgi:hypothetical protein